MTSATARTLSMTQGITESRTHNPLARFWLATLTLVFTLFVTCTLTLVAWPVIAWMSERFTS